MRRSLGAALVRFLRRLVPVPWLTNRYRPELHYMRGPGPKSRSQMRLQGVATSEAAASREQRGKLTKPGNR